MSATWTQSTTVHPSSAPPDWDIRICPAENGFQVVIENWAKDGPTIRYNAATAEDALARIGRCFREHVGGPTQ